MATVTVRIDEDLQQALDRLAEARGVSRSHLVRESVQAYLAVQQRNEAWELGKDLFGRHGSGRGDLSVDGERILRERLRASARRD